MIRPWQATSRKSLYHHWVSATPKDPARLVFDGKADEGVVVSMADLGSPVGHDLVFRQVQ
ncbi:hypothetical protein PWYN_12630 [Paenibacillus wynnii]|uniref:Uncharacterized protein n=1 Tax=Paenibacillus wynnii TaxID=268407 RepID=A0A098MDM6_9BACL|nr:hypothetical protein [Paenibacillus wynnii]KGE20086.1 hypothetical protein PWYN_12630 [Paenibacillus wynnii]